MRIALALIATFLAIPASAQTAPAKLIITWYQANITVIDYPSRERCEAAARAVKAEVNRRNVESDAASPGTVRIGTSPNGAFCIPG